MLLSKVILHIKKLNFFYIVILIIFKIELKIQL